MTLYGGIDLHSNNVMISLIDEQDQLICEKRLPNDLTSICAHLAPFQAQVSALVVESTYNWYWLVDGLIETGYDVRLANTLAIQQYNGIKYTDDASDARFLAQLLRLGILPEGYIYPPEQRSTRDLLRRRLLLVQQRRTQYMSLQSMIARHSGQRLTHPQVCRLNYSELKSYFAHAMAFETALLLREQMRCLDQAIDRIEQLVGHQCLDTPDYRLLNSVPGIGPILGQTILLETGPIERFETVGNYASYARCVPSIKLSNGKKKGQGNRKNGNRYLALAFVEAAHYASIWEPRIKQYYQRKQAKVHKMVAKKTVANKLARACFHMLTHRTPFDAQRAFG